MKIRIQPTGNKNGIGLRVTALRKDMGITQRELLARLQAAGMSINASSLSKIEGQIRRVSDVEVRVLAKVLNVSIDGLMSQG